MWPLRSHMGASTTRTSISIPFCVGLDPQTRCLRRLTNIDTIKTDAK
jgi:hypothetical protein